MFFEYAIFNESWHSLIKIVFLTGGSEWTLEDTIELKNISIPDRKTEIDLSLIYNNERNLNDPGTDSGTVLVSAQ